MFADLSASCQYKSKQTREVGTSRPYSSIDFFEFKDEHNSSGFWDRWSIGIMILEIIIGTDLLLDQTTFSQLQKLLKRCREYIDEETYEFLGCMLFSEGHYPPEEYLSKCLNKKPNLIAENVRGMNNALMEDKFFQEIKANFQ